MRITFLMTKLNFVTGGGSQFERYIKARKLSELGCDIKFITAFSYKNKFSGPYPFKVFEENLYPSKMSFFKFHKAVSNILKKYESETDIYYVDGHAFLFGAGLYRKNKGKTTVAHFEGYSFPTGLTKVKIGKRIKHVLIKYLEKSFLSYWENSLDAFFVVSKFTRDIFIERGLKRNKFIVIPIFIDFSVFSKQKEKFNCVNPHKFHILYAGRINNEKGLNILIQAMKKLSDLDICLDVVGNGPAKDKFIQLASTLGLEKNIYWYPHISQQLLGSMFRHTGVFVLPALWAEPGGTVVSEAMSAGVPVLVSSGTGAAEYVKGGGLIFESGNVDDLAGKLRHLYNNEGFRKKLSEKATQAIQNYDIDQIGKQLYDRLYKLYINSPSFNKIK